MWTWLEIIQKFTKYSFKIVKSLIKTWMEIIQSLTKIGHDSLFKTLKKTLFDLTKNVTKTWLEVTQENENFEWIIQILTNNLFITIQNLIKFAWNPYICQNLKPSTVFSQNWTKNFFFQFDNYTETLEINKTTFRTLTIIFSPPNRTPD